MFHHLVQVVMEKLNLGPTVEHKVVLHSAQVLCLISFVEFSEGISVQESLKYIQVLCEVYLGGRRVQSVVIGRVTAARIQNVGAKLGWEWYVRVE